jgi:hypothetical protein
MTTGSLLLTCAPANNVSAGLLACSAPLPTTTHLDGRGGVQGAFEQQQLSAGHSLLQRPLGALLRSQKRQRLPGALHGLEVEAVVRQRARIQNGALQPRLVRALRGLHQVRQDDAEVRIPAAVSARRRSLCARRPTHLLRPTKPRASFCIVAANTLSLSSLARSKVSYTCVRMNTHVLPICHAPERRSGISCARSSPTAVDAWSPLRGVGVTNGP